jgi:probable rRNA maturation factor
MTIHFEYEAKEKLDFDYETMLTRVVETCLDFVKCPYEATVNILFTDNDEIEQINKEYRDIDKPTDVLSFPFVDYDFPGDFSGLEENTADYFHPETGELLLGDIVISVDMAKFQAKEYGHSIEREIAFLPPPYGHIQINGTCCAPLEKPPHVLWSARILSPGIWPCQRISLCHQAAIPLFRDESNLPYSLLI